MKKIKNAKPPRNVRELPIILIGEIMKRAFPRIDRDARDAHTISCVSATCKPWRSMVLKTLGAASRRLHPESLMLATHVHRGGQHKHKFAYTGWTRKRIINGIIGGEDGGHPYGAFYTDGPFREGEATTPRLVNNGTEFPLDLEDHENPNLWHEGFVQFWLALESEEKAHAWRNHWRMAFHKRVYTDMQQHQVKKCGCICCAGRKMQYGPA